MKKTYEAPEIQIVLLENVDTIQASNMNDDAFDEVYTPWQNVPIF